MMIFCRGQQQQFYQDLQFFMSQEKVYQSIPISHTTMKRYSVVKGSKNQKPNIKKIQKLYTDSPNMLSLKKSHNQSSMHRHLYTLHSNGQACPKSKEQLYQENFQLKNENNDLRKQLTNLKIVSENQRKKNKSFTSKLNRQFRKDFYYSATNTNEKGTYMLAGIKNQYEKLKNQHGLLVQQYQKIKQSDYLQQANEYRIYAEALQLQNYRLSQKILVLQEKIPDHSAQSYSIKAAELQLKVEKLIGKNNTLKQQIKQVKKQDQENKKVIDFLEKIILRKDNSEHSAKKSSRIHHRLKQQLQKKLSAQQEHSSYLTKQYENVLKTLKTECDKKLNKQAALYKETIQEKNETIRKLQKEVAYLSTLLSYWKPNKQSEKQKNIETQQEQQVEAHSNPQNQKNYKSIQSQEKSSMKQSASQRNRVSNDDLRFSNNSFLSNINSNPGNTTRIKKSSSQKNSEHSKKMRKVNLEQIADLQEYLKFRMIGFGLTIEEAQKYFNASNVYKEGDWQYEYITHKELNTILKSDPFALNEDEAYLFTRYIVEEDCQFENGDPTNGFVYCDESNQIQRRIAQSILRAFIEKYEMPDPEQCKKRWTKLWEKNGAKVETALNSIAPNGEITINKWNDVVNGFIVGDIDNNIKNWIIGVMLIKSQGLSKLRYEFAIVKEESS